MVDRASRSTLAVYVLSLRQLTGKGRVLTIAGLALVPMIPALVWLLTSAKPSASDLDDVLINAMLASAILPIVALAVATTALGNELEDKTLSNLTLAPVARWRIVAAKLGASATLIVPVIAASGAASVLIAFTGAGLGGSARAAAAVGGRAGRGSARLRIAVRVARPLQLASARYRPPLRVRVGRALLLIRRGHEVSERPPVQRSASCRQSTVRGSPTR